MASKLGCGPMAIILLILMIILVVGMNEAVETYFVNCPDEDIVDCVLNATDEPEEEPEGSVSATGVYTYKDHSVNVILNIPLAGGAVTGTMTGTCTASIKGNYNGQNNGSISGTMSGVCSPLFVNIPASATFSGTVNKTAKSVPIGFTGRGAGITHEGSMTLKY